MLDGGLPAWRAAGGEVDTSPVDEAALHAPAQALRSPPATTKCAAVEVLGVRVVLAALRQKNSAQDADGLLQLCFARLYS